MANTNITTSQASGFIPQVWLAVALGRLKNYLTVQKTVTMDTDLEAGAFQVGQTLHIPKRGTLVVNDKIENNNYTVQNPNSSTVDLTLNNHKEVTFGIESRAISTSNQDVIQGYVEDACIALAEQIDISLMSLAYQANAGNVIINAGTLTEANILSARKILVDNKALAGQMKFGVIATSQTNALLQIDRLVRFDALGVSNDIPYAKVGDGSVTPIPGSIGRLYQFNIAESQLVQDNASTALANNLWYTKDAIVLATRELELPDPRYGVMAAVITDPDSGIALRLLHSYNAQGGAHQITIDCLYGYTLLRPEHFVVVQTSP